MGHSSAGSGDIAGIEIKRKSPNSGGVALGFFDFKVVGPDGEVKFHEENIPNTITNLGIEYLFDAGITGATAASTNWHLGIVRSEYTGSFLDPTQTMAGLGGAGGANLADDEVGRQNFSTVATSPNSNVNNGVRNVSNSGSPLTFTVGGSFTVAGVFIANSSQVNDTAATLFAYTNITPGPSVQANDEIIVTYSAIIN